MTLSPVSTLVALAYLAAAVLFVVGLHRMNSPVTARHGNRVSGAGMLIAVVATLVIIVDTGSISGWGWLAMGAGAAVGGGLGLRLAETVRMTAIPQLVSLFNAVGGGAALVVALATVVAAPDEHGLGGQVLVGTALDIVIGGTTFTGSLVAAGKLQGTISGQPLVFVGSRVVTALLAVIAVAGGVALATGNGGLGVLLVVTAASLGFGVTMVLPIGGADMPVVISLLNAFTGLAVAMAGFVIDSTALIIAGALVGASGGILTKLMADAMNRSIPSIIAGGFGTGDASAVTGGPAADVQSITADDAALRLAYARSVVIVPGYGLAAAQAQHEVRDLATLLEQRGVQVSFAIHPVAGRMPGHMNVLLAEANIPYTSLREMDEVNPTFPDTDVALVVGANDVTNPAARRPNTPISGMPILDVDRARSVIVIKRSMGTGYAGIDNELYALPNTAMFFADAKRGLAAISAAVKELVPA